MSDDCSPLGINIQDRERPRRIASERTSSHSIVTQNTRQENSEKQKHFVYGTSDGNDLSNAACCCSLFFVEPQWETNDDVAMSMVSHGYDIASEPSPNLIFSNVIWDYISLRSFLIIMGIPGYFALSLLALMFAGGVVYFGIVKLGNGRLIASLICLLIFARPFVFPQFTLTSGLLAVAGFVSLSLFLVKRHWSYLLLALIVMSLSFLMRSQEFFLVALVATTLLPLRTLASNPALISTVCAFGLFIIVVTYVDTASYYSDSWSYFNELNPLRAAFTDFNMTQAVQAHPDVMARYGFTQTISICWRTGSSPIRLLRTQRQSRMILADIVLPTKA